MVGGGGDAGADGGGPQEETRGNLWPLLLQVNICQVRYVRRNKGIGDAGSTADFRMLWSAMVCFGLLQSAFVCLVCLGLP